MAWRRYWDEAVETMPADARRLADDRQLGQQIEYCLATSVYYRRKFADAGVDAAAIGTVDDLARLPFSTKDELRARLIRAP